MAVPSLQCHLFDNPLSSSLENGQNLSFIDINGVQIWGPKFSHVLRTLLKPNPGVFSSSLIFIHTGRFTAPLKNALATELNRAKVENHISSDKYLIYQSASKSLLCGYYLQSMCNLP